MRRIVIIGSGPSAIYALKELICSRVRLSITIIESKSMAGVGNPYDPATTDAAMLANIASIELPPVVDRLSDWLLSQDDQMLSSVGLQRDAVDERAFVPRIAIGAYYAGQLATLVAAASRNGHAIEILVESRVVDVVEGVESVSVTLTNADGEQATLQTDLVVIAIGHGDGDDAANAGRIATPAYPLQPVPDGARRIGVLGTSLSAIDVVVGVALQFGDFHDDDRIWRTHESLDSKAPVSITMMSRRGLLPEADFFAPLPYAPLAIFRPDALAADDNTMGSLLDRAFALFKRELASCDPAYAAAIRLQEASPEDMAERYFGPRLACDPFDHARSNLAEAIHGHENRQICAWRYAILRMHEPFEALVPRFSARDKTRFDAGLKAIFIDNYAAVPHRSVSRLLALRDAGVLAIERVSPGYTIAEDEGAFVVSSTREMRFDHLVDARGQRARRAVDLPFPTLRLRLLAQEMRDGAIDLETARIDVDDSFALSTAPGESGRIYVTAVPYMLHDRPFSQGLTAACDIGTKVGRAILAEHTQDVDDAPGAIALRDLIDGPMFTDGLLFVNGEVMLAPRAHHD